MYKGKERIQMSTLMMMMMTMMMITSTVSPWRTVHGGPSKASHLEWRVEIMHVLALCDLPVVFQDDSS